MAEDRDDARGWASIEAAFSETYPSVEPRQHFAPEPPRSLGGILDGISAFESGTGWHLVTFGLTELYAKDSDDPRVSGWGYELTMRTRAADEPPGWALELLLAVAQLTQEGGVVFGDGHRLDVGTGGWVETDICFPWDEWLRKTRSGDGSFMACREPVA